MSDILKRNKLYSSLRGLEMCASGAVTECNYVVQEAVDGFLKLLKEVGDYLIFYDDESYRLLRGWMFRYTQYLLDKYTKVWMQLIANLCSQALFMIYVEPIDKMRIYLTMKLSTWLRQLIHFDAGGILCTIAVSI